MIIFSNYNIIMALDEKNSDRKSSEGFIGKSIDWIFANKSFVLILSIFIVAIFLRYLAAVSIEPNADEMVHGPHALGIIDSGVIGRVWQSILWSYLTNFFYIIGGTTMLMARSLSFIFGSLSIILVYLLGKEIFDKKIAILAAAFLTFSSFHLINILVEMDIAAIFFVLYASLFFIRGLKKDGRFSYIAAVLIGVAALIKTLSLFFVPAFLIGFFVYHNKLIDKKLIIKAVKFCLIIVLVASPLLIHNYIWYNEKGMVDAYLSQYFDIGKSREVFAGIQGINNGFKFSELISGSISVLGDYFSKDPISLALGILGLMFFMYKKEKFALFFILFQVIPFLLITTTNRLSTHYAVFPPVFALYGAAFTYNLVNQYKGKIDAGKIILAIIAIMVMINGIVLTPYLASKTGMTEMREYTISSIGKEDIVIADARIYRGRIMWMFNDRHYLEASYLPNLIAVNNNLTAQGGPTRTYDMYFVECVVDDCGWGTIGSQPEFNQSMEEVVLSFKSSAREEKIINGGGNPAYYPSKPYFRVYSAAIKLDERLIPIIDSTHNFFYYPLNYLPRDQIIDNYESNGFVNSLLYYFAKIIIWASFAISLGSIFYLLYELYKK